MRERIFMRNSSRAALLICSLMILCVAVSTTPAQSGRRAKERGQPPPPPVQQTTGTEPAQPAPPAKPEARPVSLIVTITEDLAGSSVSLGDSQLVMRGFVERLKKDSAIKHKVERRMDRKEAGNLAKSQTESYVVWLQLDRRMISSRTDNNEVFVEYAVFTPGTGKTKTEGRVFVRGSRQSIGIGGVPVGVPLPPTVTGNTRLDVALLDAGRETAERVMPELDVLEAQ
jgi:hypothetical protein